VSGASWLMVENDLIGSDAVERVAGIKSRAGAGEGSRLLGGSPVEEFVG